MSWQSNFTLQRPPFTYVKAYLSKPEVRITVTVHFLTR
jgi:hypothetical protein